jgi:SAM-dependent methyltransferase
MDHAMSPSDYVRPGQEGVSVGTGSGRIARARAHGGPTVAEAVASADVDPDAFRELLTPRGQRALAEAMEITAAVADPVAAATRLRRTYDAPLTAAVLTQAALRRRARDKFGADADVMYFTPHGLEQATRTEVAAHRAHRIAAAPRSDGAMNGTAGGATAGTGGLAAGAAGSAAGGGVAGGLQGGGVADLCCGIGGDLIALARAGCDVEAVDADPLTAAIAAANAEALGLGSRVSVRVGDAADLDPHAYAVVFADPARRTARGRVFDPPAYSPPWPVVLDIVSRAKGACLKVAPGIPDEFVPEGAEAEWVSFRGEVKEAVLWCGDLPARPVRRATLLPSGETLVADPALEPAPVGPVGTFVFEPDGAAIRAGLVAQVAAMVGGRLLDPRIAYITGDSAATTPWAARYRVVETLPFSLKRLRAALRAHKAGIVTIKKRGSAVDVERLRRDLRPSGPESATVILTRIGEKPFAIVCHPD